MDGLEVKVSSILDELINATVSEMSRDPGDRNSTGLSPCVSENTEGSADEKVRGTARAAPEPLLLPFMRRSWFIIEIEQLALVSIYFNPVFTLFCLFQCSSLKQKLKNHIVGCSK